MTGKRCSPRMNRRLSVKFGPGELLHLGYTVDLSREGLFIGANTVYRSGVVLHVQLSTSSGDQVLLVGEVRWAKKMPAQYAHKLRSGMGLRITRILQGDALYDQLCERGPSPARP